MLEGLPCPPSGNLPDPGIEPESLTSSALASGFFTTSTTWEAPKLVKSQANQFKVITLTEICETSYNSEPRQD